ncbi:MAG: hypothetical protein ACYCW6_26125 [Candidatus Xenobia bacterium]
MTVALLATQIGILGLLGVWLSGGRGWQIPAEATLLLAFGYGASQSAAGHRQRGLAIVILVVLLELGSFCGSFMRLTPVEQVEQQIAAPPSLATPPERGRGLTYVEPGNGVGTHYAMAWRVRSIQGFDATALRTTDDYLFHAEFGCPMDEETLTRILDRASFFQMVPVQNPMLRMLDLQWVLQRHGDTLARRELPGGFGPGWLVGQGRVMPREDQLMALSHESVDPGQVVLLEAPLPPVRPHATGKVSLVSWSPDRIRYTVEASADAYAVFSEVWYPGWRAHIDGHNTPVARGDGLLRTIWVPAGHHEVEMVYCPFWLFAFPISILTALITLAGVKWR